MSTHSPLLDSCLIPTRKLGSAWQWCYATNRSSAVTESKLAYSPQEAADVSSLSLRAIWRAIESGDLKSSKVGRRRFIRVIDLESFLRRSAWPAASNIPPLQSHPTQPTRSPP